MTPIPELISLAQFRLSLYSIFNITDDLEMANIKTKKVRNQVRMVNTRIDSMEAELKKLKEGQKGASHVDLNDTFGNNKSVGIDLSPLKVKGDNPKDTTPNTSNFLPPISLGALMKK